MDCDGEVDSGARRLRLGTTSGAGASSNEATPETFKFVLEPDLVWKDREGAVLLAAAAAADEYRLGRA